MLNLPPIPLKILEHSVNHAEANGVDTFGKKTFKTAVSIKFVRCQPTKKKLNGSLGFQNDDRAVLFYDYTHSSPKNVIFKKDDKIIYKNVVYYIREVVDFDGHHVELILI